MQINHKFKIGDRVRCIEPYAGLAEGEYTVVYLSDICPTIRVKGIPEHCWNDGRFTLVPTTDELRRPRQFKAEALAAGYRPVDHDLPEARKIAAWIGHDRGYTQDWIDRVAGGEADFNEYVIGALAGLKRGRELAAQEAEK